MALVTQANYARRRGISREAVRQRAVTAGGPVPVHGPRKLLDVAEANALWETTKSTAGAFHTNGTGVRLRTSGHLETVGLATHADSSGSCAMPSASMPACSRRRCDARKVQ